MKITDVKTVLLTGPCTNDPFLSEARKRRSAAFIEIHTDTELVGLGETYTGYFFPEVVPEIVEFFKPILIGNTVDNIDLLWNRMYQCGNFWCRNGMGLQVLSGIEAALYDLKSKMYGIPVYELLGGRKHESLLCYATGGPANYPVDKLFKKIEYYMSLGFKGVKIGAGEHHSGVNGGLGRFVSSSIPSEAADIEGRKLEAIKQRFGKEVKMMMDGHMGNWPDMESIWTLETAKAVMKVCDEYDLYFFEEPLHYNDPWSYSELSKSTGVTVAGGECLAGAAEWKLYIEKDCFDLGQPDAAYVGGFGQFMKIAQLLEGRNRKLATHSWAGGGGFMQNIHAAFACPNTAIVEIAPDYGPLHSEIIEDSFVMKNGRVLPPDKPGLGIVLTDKTKERFPFVRGSGEFNSVPGKILTD
jgi:L-alanine-DL-glutamate epimerase and related enzymes of enolase superfamily